VTANQVLKGAKLRIVMSCIVSIIDPFTCICVWISVWTL